MAAEGRVDHAVHQQQGGALELLGGVEADFGEVLSFTGDLYREARLLFAV